MLIHMNKEIPYKIRHHPANQHHQYINTIKPFQVNFISKRYKKEFEFILDSINFIQESVEYIPPEISSVDHDGSDVCCHRDLFIIIFILLILG
jgi:hypothetical protein